MGAAQPPVSWDDRLVLERARRSQLIKVCRAEGIEVKREDMPKKFYLNMLEQNGINLSAPHKALEWYQVHGKDEQGNSHVETYPVVPEHDSAKEQIDYDAEIAARAEQAKQLEDAEKLTDEQGEMIRQLMARLEALEKNTVPLERLGPPQLKRVCKERGIDTSELKTKEQLLAALES